MSKKFESKTMLVELEHPSEEEETVDCEITYNKVIEEWTESHGEHMTDVTFEEVKVETDTPLSQRERELLKSTATDYLYEMFENNPDSV